MPGTPRVEQKWSVGQFFDVEGMFDEAGLMLEISSLVQRLEAEKYESSPQVFENKKTKLGKAD
jgi:signal peptidase complex subunit 2